MGKKPTYEELEQRVKELEREVSECNRAAEELRQEQSVFIGGPVVIFRWLATENWPAAYVSPNVTQFGYQADDFISGRLPYADIIHREDLDKVLSELKEYSESGVPFYEQEYRIIQADGETRWVHDFTIVCRNDESEITHYDGYILDITERKLAEEALREREETLRALLNAPTENAMLVDLEGTILAINQVGVQRLGKSEDELIGMQMFDYLPRDVAESRKAQADKVVRTGKPLRFQDERAGRFYDNNIYPVFDINGKVRSLAVYASDITETKRAEYALRQSVGRWRSLVENAPDIILTVDREGTIEFINHPPAGLSVEDVIGTSALDYVVPEYRKAVRQSIGRVFQTGSPDSYEISARGPNNTTSWYSTCVGPIKHNGEVAAAILITRDISDRKRAEEELAQEKHEKEMILDSLVEHVVYHNLENKVLWANRAACESVNKTREELVGQHCYEIWAGRQSACEDCPIVKALNTGDSQAIEKSTPDGRDWYIQGYPVRGINRDIVGVVELTLDITDLRRSEEEKRKLETKLLQAQKIEAIATLAGGIAHDFNNLLTGVQGNVSIMFLDIDTTHPHYERLKSIEKQVQSGARLTSHLLGYARKGKYEVKPVDLNHLVRETSESFVRTRKDISIHQQLREELFAIEADSGQIEQVLWNLLVNAADAMPGGGDLILKTDNVTHEDMKGKLYEPKPGNYVMLTVTDTGMGMDNETMERIFNPFFTTKEMGRGTGLGLASAYGIVKGHAGYIDVESAKGVGTTFSIYLPSSEQEVQGVVKTSQEAIEGTGTILLVDDEEVILEVGKHLLEAMGYRVLTARDGREAVEICKDNRDKIDLVILDMVMPRMGGGEAYDRMKEISPNVKVLLSSGYSIDSQAKEILARGCDAFIQKPFGMQELSQKIREVL